MTGFKDDQGGGYAFGAAPNAKTLEDGTGAPTWRLESTFVMGLKAERSPKALAILDMLT